MDAFTRRTIVDTAREVLTEIQEPTKSGELFSNEQMTFYYLGRLKWATEALLAVIDAGDPS